MKDGLYVVQSYNGKDAAIVHTDGTFEVVTKSEFPPSFGGCLYVGETLVVKTIQTIDPQLPSHNERERAAYGNDVKEFVRLKDLQIKESERRARYGGIDAIRRNHDH